MTDEWTLLTRRLAESVAHQVETRVASAVSQMFKANLKLVFTEAEAAKFLGVSRDTLAAWRKSGLISHTRYPQAKSDQLSDMYTYDLDDLKAFRDRYRIRSTSHSVEYRTNVRAMKEAA